VLHVVMECKDNMDSVAWCSLTACPTRMGHPEGTGQARGGGKGVAGRGWRGFAPGILDNCSGGGSHGRSKQATSAGGGTSSTAKPPSCRPADASVSLAWSARPARQQHVDEWSRGNMRPTALKPHGAPPRSQRTRGRPVLLTRRLGGPKPYTLNHADEAAGWPTSAYRLH
jgi:hypothetical protein